MRADILVVIVMVVVSLALCTPLAGGDPAVTPPAALAALGPKAFTIQIDRIEARRSVSPPGKTRVEYEFDSVLEVKLLVSSTRSDAVLGMHLDPIATATTDAGEDLHSSQPSPSLGRSGLGFNASRHEAGVLGMLTAAFSHPKRPADTLAQLVGTVVLRCETAPAETVELKPISAWLNKPLPIAGGTLTITALSPELSYSFVGGAAEDLKKWGCYDAAGASLSNHHGSTWLSGALIKGSFRLAMPPDGSITITPVGPTVDIAVPFTFRNILLNPPPAAAAEKPLF